MMDWIIAHCFMGNTSRYSAFTFTSRFLPTPDRVFEQLNEVYSLYSSCWFTHSEDELHLSDEDIEEGWRIARRIFGDEYLERVREHNSQFSYRELQEDRIDRNREREEQAALAYQGIGY